MSRGKFQVMFRGAITLKPEMRQTKTDKLVLGINCAYSEWSPNGTVSKYVTVNFWGGQAQLLYKLFEDGTYQVGDIMHVDNGTIDIYVYTGKDGNTKHKIILTPDGRRREQKDSSGKTIFREDGTPATDWWAEYEITPGKNHVWQSDAVPEPKEERQAVPPADFVDVTEDGPLPWEE